MDPVTPEAAAHEIYSGHWETEKRIGVEHYAAGQIKALKVDGDGQIFYILGYTPGDGHGIHTILCTDDNGDWEILFPVGIRVDGMGQWEVPLPDDFKLSERMIAALDEARG